MIKVSLVNPDREYSICNNNPKVGTKFECEGVLKRIKGNGLNYVDGQNDFDMERVINTIENANKLTIGLYSITVYWDNGTSNSYKPGELKVLNNKAAKCVSIW